MASSAQSESPPSPDEFRDLFSVYDVQHNGDEIWYYGIPHVDREQLVRSLWPIFDDAGYELRHAQRTGEDILIATPADTQGLDGIPWLHVSLFGLTVLSTLFAGALWFHVDVFADPFAIWKGWPFAVAVLTVLGVHELGHYVMGRYHGVNVTLPYFVPLPTLIGTMGAVIRIKSRIPSRKALFDIGVAGPLAGLVATVVVTLIGLSLGPITVPEQIVQAETAIEVTLGYPPLMEGLAWITGQQLYYDDPTKMVHPIVIGGWIGMFITFLNMIPVGQLDGGHVMRALAAEYQETVAALVPGALFALSGFLYFIKDVPFQSVFVWILWGSLTTVIAVAGPATPIQENESLGTVRVVLGILTIILALLCFVPVPVAVA